MQSDALLPPSVPHPQGRSSTSLKDMEKEELFFKEKHGLAAVRIPSSLVLQMNLRSGLSKLGALSRVVHCFGTGPMVLNIWFSTIRPTQETIKITLNNMHPVKKHTSEQCLLSPFLLHLGLLPISV